MTGRAHPLATGHVPAAHEHRAAGTLYAWVQDRLRELAAILVVGTLATGVFLAAMGVVALIVGVAHAQEPGPQTPRQGGEAKVGGVTVTAPDCRIPQNPAPACAAQRLNQAAKAAQASAQGAPTVTVPDASAPAATIGLGTPAAAAQQPGTPFGKVPGYVPPPPVVARNGAGGAFARTRP